MTDKTKNGSKIITGLAAVLTTIVLLVWIRMIRDEQKILRSANNAMRDEIHWINRRLEEVEKSIANKEQEEAKVYYDSPTDAMPRMVKNGIFPLKTSQRSDYESVGRRPDDMNLTAVLIECTNQNDTDRVVNLLKKQRKSEKDLPIFVYTQTEISGVDSALLKIWAKRHRKVYKLNQTTFMSALLHVVTAYKKDFVISIRDYDKIGYDFADFYFIGQKIMKIDENVESVCGGSNGIWQNKERADILWLSDSKCDFGEMRSARTADAHFIPRTNISLRSEVSRVGHSERSVTDDLDYWNIDQFDPTLMEVEQFELRLTYDLGEAERKLKNEWNILQTFEKSNKIYMFPYESKEDLREYFEKTDVNKLHTYKGIVSLSLGDYNIYIVPMSTFETRRV